MGSDDPDRFGWHRIGDRLAADGFFGLRPVALGAVRAYARARAETTASVRMPEKSDMAHGPDRVSCIARLGGARPTR